MPVLEIQDIIILIFVGFIGGFIDSIAGGGGIISVPALLLVGFPPHLALGTNKLQASFGSITAATRYARSGLVVKKGIVRGIFMTAIGAALGTFTVQQISPGFLKHAVIVLLLVVFIYSLLNRKLGKSTKDPLLETQVFYLLFGLMLGFYDGFFGPGTGSFWALAFVLLLGFDLKRATAHTKIMNATSNIVSLAFFFWFGSVAVVIGVVMGFAQVAGAWTGTHLVIKKEVDFIRVVFLSVVGLTLLKMLVDSYLA